MRSATLANTKTFGMVDLVGDIGLRKPLGYQTVVPVCFGHSVTLYSIESKVINGVIKDYFTTFCTYRFELAKRRAVYYCLLLMRTHPWHASAADMLTSNQVDFICILLTIYHCYAVVQ